MIYVWFDALANYISALEYGVGGERYREWWEGSDERVHVIGKGIIRFHAVYWPAILLSAGEALPTAIFVHDYLSVEGQKLSKSAGHTHDPVEIADRFGTDALRWWFLRDVPRTGDADFREALLAVRANELADGLGNLVNRTITLVNRYRPQGVVATPSRSGEATTLHAVLGATPAEIDTALAHFDFRAATTALWRLVDAANRFVTTTRPWELAKAEAGGGPHTGSSLDEVLHALLSACSVLARELEPFLPAASGRIARALSDSDPQRGRRLFIKPAPPRDARLVAAHPRSASRRYEQRASRSR